MPLARIITEVADDCLELTMQLRARGFQVETVAPGVVSSTPADLEVRLEECAPEDVVSHMAQNSAGDDLWVFVAPGALDSNSVPIRNTPVSIDPVMPRIGLGKGDAKRFAIERLMERTVTVSPLTIAGQDMTIGARGKTETLPVIGALAINAQEEDLILAELNEFPKLGVDIAPVISVQPKVEGTNQDATHSGLTAKLFAISEKEVEEKKHDAEVRLAHRPAKEIQLEPQKAVGAKWLTTPGKLTPSAANRMTIPVVPDPVRAKIVLPPTPVVRKAGTPQVWNLQKLKVACAGAALAVSAWFLIGTAHLGDASNANRPASASSTRQSPQHTADQSQKQVNPQSKTVPTSDVATIVQKPKATVTSSTKPRPHRLQGDDQIAEDTVVFYDRKPGPRATATQPEPGVKNYSDRN